MRSRGKGRNQLNQPEKQGNRLKTRYMFICVSRCVNRCVSRCVNHRCVSRCVMKNSKQIQSKSCVSRCVNHLVSLVVS